MARNRRKFRELFHVEAERMTYYYAFPEELPDPLTGIVGYVVNDSAPGLKIALEIDEEYLKGQKSIFPLLYIDPENYIGDCRIVLTKEMFERLQKQDPEILFGLWHEVGQFHTMEEHVEEYLSYSDRSNSGMTADQYLAMLNNELLPYQEAADAFAQAYCGRDESIIAINGMISRAKKHPETMNDRALLQELLIRKKAVSAREMPQEK